MRALSIGLLLAAALPCLAQSNPALETVKVKIEAPALDTSLLLRKLNAHGPDHGLRFEAADEGFAYRVVFSTEQEKTQLLFGGSGGGMNTSAATAKVFDAKGTELFDVKRAGRGTDAGATNALAKEIIKRLLQWRKEQAKEAGNAAKKP